MARPKHYSPQLSRFVVSILYHEAKHRKIPMTKLTDQLLLQALRGSHGWNTATTLSLAAESPTEPHPLPQAA